MSVVRGTDPQAGRSLGEFVLRERIGQGGFGAVYRAHQPVLDREAVVKVLHAELTVSPAATERFLREARLASKLDHPYAAHIYAFGAEPGGDLWIAMELVRGTPLDQVLKIQGPLPVERFVPLLDRICEVVHSAHEQGIVHRDLKPANVMVLARAGRLLPKLLDFGIAKGLAVTGGSEPPAGDLGHDSTVRVTGGLELDTTVRTGELAVTLATPAPVELTQRGAIMGSPPYMAPEQWVDAGQVDARTDLYALGVLAYECLTGKPPFVGATLTQMAQAHAKQQPAALPPRFPAALDQVFAKVLAKHPDHRYPDALAFAAAFRQASGISVEPASLPALDPVRRDAALGTAPQPIAEAVAALDAARNAHQARDALVQLARTTTRYLGLLALACRSRVSGGDEPAAVAEALRTLSRRPLADREWLELARELTGAWIARRDAYPVPELVDACQQRGVLLELDALVALRDREPASEEALVELLEREVARAGKLLEAIAFLGDYALVVTVAPGSAERWMGVRRTQRTTVTVRGKGLATGVPALLDPEGVPVLSLAPLFQVEAPTPGAPPELFLFDGRDARGAKLVALPAGFEHHDDELWDWFRAQLAGSLDEGTTALAEEKPPYRGLSAFSSEDGARFFGREKQVDAFVNRLKLQPLLAVVGRSGAGKSSFVHAGVVPALAGWRAIALRPGPAPLAALVARLEHSGIAGVSRDELAEDREVLGATLRADAARRGPVVLVVDQLEELFTLCDGDAERRAFAAALAAAARGADDPVRVICTLRDDFLVRTEQVPALRNRLGQSLQLLAVPGTDDLLRILVEPARRAGYEFDDAALPAEMVEEVADRPGALALLSFTAAKLWELRDRHFHQLTRAAYRSLGGVGGALARHADITLDEMPPEQRALAREAFRHLVTSQNTRAVVTRTDLRQLLGRDAHADHVIEKLVAARLLVTSENEAGQETIELVHEALLATWPRLAEWRREDAEGARFREQLRAAAQQWRDRGRPRGLLWRGDALADYTRWRARHAGPLTDLEAAFTTASEADAARGRRNRRALLASAFAALVAVVVVLLVFNTRIDGQRARAEDAAAQLRDNLRHQLEDQGRRYVLDGDPLKALAYLSEAASLGEHGLAHDLLIAEAVRASDGELLEVHHDTAIRSPRFSHDGTRLVTAGFDHVARIWDARDGKLLANLPHAGVVPRAEFAPDDRTVLTASFDGTAVLWDAASGAALHRFRHTGRVWCALYSPDGTTALTAGEDDALALWDLASGGERVRVHGGGAGFTACAFSPDGALVAAGDRGGTTRIWDARTGQLVHELRGQHGLVHTVAFAPDGARLVTASFDGTAAVWQVASGARLQLLAHDGAVNSAEFSPDGRSILTGSSDRTAILWDAATGQRLRVLAGHTAGVNRAAFSPDGKLVVTASDDATAWLWEAATGRVQARWHGHRELVYDAAFSPHGRRVVTAGEDGAAILWKVQPQEPVLWLREPHSQISLGTFSRDGSRVVTAGDDTAAVWDPVTGRELAVLRVAGTTVAGVAISPDGRAVATGGDDGTVRLWDVATATVRAVLTGATAGITQVSWSADGSSIVASSRDGSIRCWDAAGRLRFANRGHGGFEVWSATFDDTGTRIITTGNDVATRTWDLRGKQLAEHRSATVAGSAVFDPTGRRVLSAVFGQRATIWDARSGDELVELVGHAGALADATWSADGRFAITASWDGTARVWDAETGDELLRLVHPGQVQSASLSRDGRRLLVTGAGLAAIHLLPRLDRSPRQLDRLLRCRVPFEVRGDRLRPRTTPRTGCVY